MPKENETGVSREDAQNAYENLFGDTAADPAAAVGEEEEAKDSTGQEAQGSDDAENQDSGDESGPADDQAAEDGSRSVENEAGGDESGPAEDPASEGEGGPPEELKVVVSIRGGRATIGIQRPSSDPHIESFDDPELPALAGEVSAVIERARARWEEAPRHPAYTRPTRSTSDRRRREQGSAQDSAADAEAARQQPRLF